MERMGRGRSWVGRVFWIMSCTSIRRVEVSGMGINMLVVRLCTMSYRIKLTQRVPVRPPSERHVLQRSPLRRSPRHTSKRHAQ